MLPLLKSSPSLCQRFKGTRPADFGEDVRFCCTAEWAPPPGFECVWSICTTVEQKLSLYFGFNPAELDRAGWEARYLVVVADLADVTQVKRVSMLNAALQGRKRGTLAMLLVPHPGPPHAAPLDPSFLLEARKELCLDGVVPDVARGLRFALHVRQQLRTLRTRMAFVLAVCRERQAASAKAASLRGKIDRLLWEYMAVHRMRFLPPQDPGLEANGEICIPDFSVGQITCKRSVWGSISHKLTCTHTGEAQTLHVLRKSGLHAIVELVGTKVMFDIMTKLRDECPHPNVLKLHEVYHSPKLLMFRVEDSGSESLYGRLHRRELVGLEGVPLAAAKVVEAVLQIWGAIAHLHTAAGVCHRDIKPESFLVNEAPESISIKLTNFALAAAPTKKRLCLTLCGTSPFVAPEVLTSPGQPYDGRKADMWSLGILLMEVLCGLRVVERALELRSANQYAGDLPDDATIAAICGGFQARGAPGNLLVKHIRSELRVLSESMQEAVDGLVVVDVDGRWAADRLLSLTEEVKTML